MSFFFKEFIYRIILIMLYIFFIIVVLLYHKESYIIFLLDFMNKTDFNAFLLDNIFLEFLQYFNFLVFIYYQNIKYYLLGFIFLQIFLFLLQLLNINDNIKFLLFNCYIFLLYYLINITILYYLDNLFNTFIDLEYNFLKNVLIFNNFSEYFLFNLLLKFINIIDIVFIMIFLLFNIKFLTNYKINVFIIKIIFFFLALIISLKYIPLLSFYLIYVFYYTLT